MSKTKIRTLFLSDLHIFSPKCNSKELLELLSSVEFQQLYLVGDIFDFTFCRRFGIDSDFNHLKLMAKLFNISNDPDIDLIFILGNHESNFLEEVSNFNVRVLPHRVYYTSKHKRYLVTHGHEKSSTFQKKSTFYLKEKFFLNLVQFPFGKQIAKLFKLKSLLNHPKFKEWVIKYENKMLSNLIEFEGVICGHSHSPCQYKKDGKWFINLGDFVSNNSYLVETLDGQLELKSWNDLPLRCNSYD